MNYCTHVSTVIFTVNCLQRLKKSLNITKIIAMQMVLYLHAKHKVFFNSDEKFLLSWDN